MRTASIIIAIGLFFGCEQERNTLSNTTKDIIIEDVNATLQKYLNDVKDRGLLAELNYLDHSPDFFWIPPGYKQPIFYDSVVSVLEANAPRFKSVKNSFDTLRIIPLSERLAIYTGKLRSVTIDTMNHMTESHLIETGVVIKRKDGWKLLSGQTSLIE